jgi:hypothetical protein
MAQVAHLPVVEPLARRAVDPERQCHDAMVILSAAALCARWHEWTPDFATVSGPQAAHPRLIEHPSRQRDLF